MVVFCWGGFGGLVVGGGFWGLVVGLVVVGGCFGGCVLLGWFLGGWWLGVFCWVLVGGVLLGFGWVFVFWLGWWLGCVLLGGGFGGLVVGGVGFCWLLVLAKFLPGSGIEPEAFGYPSKL